MLLSGLALTDTSPERFPFWIGTVMQMLLVE
jgi:hypothetical protein